MRLHLRVWQYLHVVTVGLEPGRNGLSCVAIFLRPDTNPMPLALLGRHLAQERCVTLLAKIGGQPLGVLLVAEAAQLYSPHASS